MYSIAMFQKFLDLPGEDSTDILSRVRFCAQKYLEVHQDDSRAALLMGLVYERMGKPGDALIWLDRAEKLTSGTLSEVIKTGSDESYLSDLRKLLSAIASTRARVLVCHDRCSDAVEILNSLKAPEYIDSLIGSLAYHRLG